MVDVVGSSRIEEADVTALDAIHNQAEQRKLKLRIIDARDIAYVAAEVRS
jgi:hypothetical protein